MVPLHRSYIKMEDRHPHPEELFNFPCDHIFKAFGPDRTDGGFAQAVLAAVTTVVPVPLDAMKVRSSAKGTYVCVSVVVRVVNFDQVKNIYNALGKVPEIRFLL
jgi:uncharacterized protein